jgi:hypothetical protein
LKSLFALKYLIVRHFSLWRCPLTEPVQPDAVEKKSASNRETPAVETWCKLPGEQKTLFGLYDNPIQFAVDLQKDKT